MTGDAGFSTVEAALAIVALVVVMALCAGGVGAILAQVRCIDAAREAARLAARGDDRSAMDAARSVAPSGAAVDLRRDGGFVTATVTVATVPLPGVTVGAKAVAALEPSR